MTDFTAAGTSGGLCFTNGIRREVIVVNVSLRSLIVDTVKNLLIADRTKRGNGKYLCLSSGKQTGAMYSRQNTDLRSQRTHLIHLSSVYTLLFIQQPTADNIFLCFIQTVLNFFGLIGIDFIEFSMNRIIDGFQSFVTNLFVIRIQCYTDIINGECLDSLIHFRFRFITWIGEFLTADFCLNTLDKLNDCLIRLMTGHNTVIHHIIRYDIGTCFDHSNTTVGRSNCNRHLTNITLCFGRIDHELAIYQTNRNC